MNNKDTVQRVQSEPQFKDKTEKMCRNTQSHVASDTIIERERQRE